MIIITDVCAPRVPLRVWRRLVKKTEGFQSKLQYHYRVYQAALQTTQTCAVSCSLVSICNEDKAAGDISLLNCHAVTPSNERVSTFSSRSLQQILFMTIIVESISTFEWARRRKCGNSSKRWNMTAEAQHPNPGKDLRIEGTETRNTGAVTRIESLNRNNLTHLMLRARNLCHFPPITPISALFENTL